MQLTQFTDYALRSLVYLGSRTDRLCTVGEIAGAYGISVSHLTKVINRLGSCGYIDTVRGKGGGVRLARAPRLIGVGDVVRHMEERFHIVECFDPARRSCPLLPGCILKSVLAEAQRNFLATLDRYTLEDVVRAGPAGQPALAGITLTRAVPEPT